MQATARLLAITLLGPFLAHVVGGLILSTPLLFFTAVVSYPVSAVLTVLSLVPLHTVFSRGSLSARHQIPLVVAWSSVVGLLLFVVLFWPPQVQLALPAWYAAFGVLNGLLCWGLYNWGPLKVPGRGELPAHTGRNSGQRSNMAVDSDTQLRR